MANPTHLTIVAARTIWAQRRHLGEATAEGQEPMRVVVKGSEVRCEYAVARDLIIQDSAVEKNSANSERIAGIRKEVSEELETFKRNEAAAAAKKQKLVTA